MLDDHITVTQVYRLLRTSATSVGIEIFSTHSLSKAWGYLTYKASRYNIGLIMDTFNHTENKYFPNFLTIDIKIIPSPFL